MGAKKQESPGIMPQLYFLVCVTYECRTQLLIDHAGNVTVDF